MENRIEKLYESITQTKQTKQPKYQISICYCKPGDTLHGPYKESSYRSFNEYTREQVDEFLHFVCSLDNENSIELDRIVINKVE